MTASAKSYDALYELIAEVCESGLDRDQASRLETMVVDDPVAREIYRRSIYAHAMLVRAEVSPCQDVVTQRAPTVGVGPVVGGWFDWRRHPLMFGLSVVTITFVGWALFFLLVLPRWQDADVPVARQRAGRLEPIVTVSDAEKPVWGEGAVAWRSGARLVAGRSLDLQSGLVWLEFVSGARVVLEGPARLTLQDAMTVRLDVGRVAARVEPQATGFVVETPAGRIVDLGTEFLVEVDDQQTAQVQVFEGAVLAQLAGQSVPGTRVARGEAVRLVATAAGTGIEAIRPQPNDLVRRLASRQVVPVEPIEYHYQGRDLPGSESDRSDVLKTKLVDGYVGTGRLADGAWVGVIQSHYDQGDDRQPQPRVQFKLIEANDAPVQLVKLAVDYLVDREIGIHAPSEVRITLSEDNTFDADDVQVVSREFNSEPDAPGRGRGDVRRLVVDLEGNRARYVQIDFMNAREWTFLGEVKFYGRVGQEDEKPSELPDAERLDKQTQIQHRRFITRQRA